MLDVSLVVVQETSDIRTHLFLLLVRFLPRDQRHINVSMQMEFRQKKKKKRKRTSAFTGEAAYLLHEKKPPVWLPAVSQRKR